MSAGLLAGLLVCTFGVGAAGCFNQVADHCPGCRVVKLGARSLPRLRAQARAWVVMVPGALGFGDEWLPIEAALAAEPALDAFVYEWPGPWQHPSDDARQLAAVLQTAVSAGPKTVLVIGHSAGAMLAACAAGLVKVPPGHRLIVAAIAAPGIFKVTPYHPERHVDTPLGVAVGGAWPDPPPPGPRIFLTYYRTDDPPAVPPRPVVRTAWVWLGAHAGHNRSLAEVAVRLIRALAADSKGSPRAASVAAARSSVAPAPAKVSGGG